MARKRRRPAEKDGTKAGPSSGEKDIKRVKGHGTAKVETQTREGTAVNQQSLQGNTLMATNPDASTAPNTPSKGTSAKKRKKKRKGQQASDDRDSENNGKRKDATQSAVQQKNEGRGTVTLPPKGKHKNKEKKKTNRKRKSEIREPTSEKTVQATSEMVKQNVLVVDKGTGPKDDAPTPASVPEEPSVCDMVSWSSTDDDDDNEVVKAGGKDVGALGEPPNSNGIMAAMENHLQCPICLCSPFARPVTLLCGHTYCHTCLWGVMEENLKVKDTLDCVVCRKPIVGPPSVSTALNAIGWVYVAHSPPEFRQAATRRLEEALVEMKRIALCVTGSESGDTFASVTYGPLKYDSEDEIYRCPRCSWEADEAGVCHNPDCGYRGGTSQMREEDDGGQGDDVFSDSQNGDGVISDECPNEEDEAFVVSDDDDDDFGGDGGSSNSDSQWSDDNDDGSGSEGGGSRLTRRNRKILDSDSESEEDNDIENIDKRSDSGDDDDNDDDSFV